MKRPICLILIILLALSLTACHYNDSGDILEPVEFFYPRNLSDYVYGASDGLIAAEVREASGHVDDLNYLIAMYLRGPQDEALHSPFPAGCRLEKVYTDDSTLYVRLSSEFTTLENIDLTIACASLAKTFLTMTGFDYICIDAASSEKTVHVILDEDAIVFSDYSAFDVPPSAEYHQ